MLMRVTPILIGLAAAVTTPMTVSAEPPAAPARAQPLLGRIASEVSAERLRGTIAALVDFGTRHTASDTASTTRGIGAARRWVKARFEALGQDCAGCLEIATPSQTVSGPRLAKPTEIMDVLAIQRGTSDPQRVVVIAGHLDSRVTDVMNATSDAPGADDDGSGVAAVMEAARLLSKHRFPGTLVFAVLSGEEQGLYGGKLLADYAKISGWRVEADLNNDIVGNTTGLNGVHDDRHVRVFSEGTKAVETPEQADRRRYNGGEVDSPSRNLARYMDGLAARYLKRLTVTMVYRTDRYGRGGDQVPMLEAGFPSVRVTEAAENYNRQHQDVRVENGVRYGDVLDGVDFRYLARVTALNAITLASLASAPPPPTHVAIQGAVSDDTVLTWTASPGAVGYRVWWRATTDPRWSWARETGGATRLQLEDVVIDDWFFGVSAVSADGWESPVEFPGAPGAFVSEPGAAAASASK
jgi:Zn-dependent M28 family amino/carboxypeptidase